MDKLEFRKLDYGRAFGITELTPEGIYELAKRLADNPDMRKEYLVRKMGLDPEIPEELEQAEKQLRKWHKLEIDEPNESG